MLCDSPSIHLTGSKVVLNEKKQLSFVYQPGVGLYDKKKRESTEERITTSMHSKRQNEEEFDTIVSDILSTNQENHQKRQLDLINHSPKKLRQFSTENLSHSIPIAQPSLSLPIESPDCAPMIKSLLMANKLPAESQSIPSQGLLLCPKEEPMKKAKKRKITADTTECLDDDGVLDSILFNEIQSVQQQWQQFVILTMEKELHITPSDGKKKSKRNQFLRSDQFLLAYESFYNFEGMKHWCPTSR